jgi:antitoxin (DNA-binding transcriptional repressor) of toxin-antitoxin stability system
MKVNVHEAKTQLSKYLDLLERGKQSVITLCRRNVPIAELRALPQPRKEPRPIGLLKGQFEVPDSFFEPLSDEELARFNGELIDDDDPVGHGDVPVAQPRRSTTVRKRGRRVSRSRK